MINYWAVINQARIIDVLMTLLPYTPLTQRFKLLENNDVGPR